jgi:hypothetical protein
MGGHLMRVINLFLFKASAMHVFLHRGLTADQLDRSFILIGMQIAAFDFGSEMTQVFILS